MNIYIIRFCCFIFLMFSYSSTYAQLDLLKKVSKSADKLINPIDKSDNDISNGLTEALKISVNKSCHEASSFGGFLNNKKIKISFPDEIIRVKKACLKLGLNDLILNFENKLNKTAEHVSVKASAIILTAVYDLKFTDALEILNGDDSSATRELRNKSSKNLYQSFYPIVQKEIENTGVNHLLDDIIKRYNQIPFIKKADFDLSDYITIKTIDGIFYLIAEKEGEIRNNPDARVTGLLKKIFK